MKRSIVALFSYFLFSVSLLLSGCAGISIPSGDTGTVGAVSEDTVMISEPDPDTVFLEDYDQFWDELEENYPFLGLLEDFGTDVYGVKDTYRESVGRIDSPEGLIVILNQVCRQLGWRAHLSVADTDTLQIFVDLKEQENESFSPWYDTVLNSRTIRLYGLEDYQPESADEDRDSEERTNSGNVLVRTYDDISAVYLRIKSFNHFYVETDKSLILEYLKEYENYDNIIIDITDNTGGDSNYWMYNIVAPFGGQFSFADDYFFEDSPAYRKFYAGWEDLNLKPVKEWDGSMKITDLRIDDLSYFSHIETTVDFSEDKSGLVDSNAKRWLLVNNGTYSSADSFASFCKKTGWATVVGERTRGDGGLEPAVIVLDNTGIVIRFSIAVKLNDDGSINNLYGTIPNELCRRKETPLETVIRLISDND